MKPVWSRSVALSLPLIAVACGASGDSAPLSTNGFPEAPYETVASEAGKLSIELRTSPRQPLDRGLAVVLYTITNGAGAPVDGLTISVTPWMPVMAHGASLRPVVSAQGNGQYIVSNLTLFMPGLWQLQTSISGVLEDRATPTLEVR